MDLNIVFVNILSYWFLVFFTTTGDCASARASRRYELELMNAVKTTIKVTPQVLKNLLMSYENYKFKNSSNLEDAHLQIDQLIYKYGYPVEKHEVVTEDGYVLTLFRIPGSGPPVFLMHGLLMSGDDWVTPGPNKGIAYLLAAEGYDVWIGNSRGTKHSRRHMSMSPSTGIFWDFTWSEIGYYDVPVMIDYVLKITGFSQITYICHSQGCTVFFVLASEKPEYNNKIKLVICLAPVAAILDTKSPIFTFSTHFTHHRPERVFAMLRQAGVHEFLGTSPLMESFIKNICGDFDLSRIICSNIVFLICGFSYGQLDIPNLPVIYAHSPTASATKQIEHFAQTFSARKFQKFDYGLKKNILRYGSKHPPEYRLDSVSVPVAVFYSNNDWLSTENNIKFITKRLRNVVDIYKVPDEHFNHIDFVHAKDIRTLIFPRILKLLKDFT